MHKIPVPKKQKEEDSPRFKTSLVYIAGSRSATVTYDDFVIKK